MQKMREITQIVSELWPKMSLVYEIYLLVVLNSITPKNKHVDAFWSVLLFIYLLFSILSF